MTRLFSLSRFLKNILNWACLAILWLKDIFDLSIQSWALFSFEADASTSTITENSKMFQSDIRLNTSWKLVNIGKEKKWSESPSLMFCNFDEWPLRIILWYLFCRKNSIIFKRLLSIPFFFFLAFFSAKVHQMLGINPGINREFVKMN